MPALSFSNRKASNQDDDGTRSERRDCAGYRGKQGNLLLLDDACGWTFGQRHCVEPQVEMCDGIECQKLRFLVESSSDERRLIGFRWSKEFISTKDRRRKRDPRNNASSQYGCDAQRPSKKGTNVTCFWVANRRSDAIDRWYNSRVRLRTKEHGMVGHRDFLFFPPESIGTTIPNSLSRQFPQIALDF